MYKIIISALIMVSVGGVMLASESSESIAPISGEIKKISSREKRLRRRVDKVMAAVVDRGHDFTRKQMRHLAECVTGPRELYAKNEERGWTKLSDYLWECLDNSAAEHLEYGGHLMRLIDETCQKYILAPQSVAHFACRLDEMVAFLEEALAICESVYDVRPEDVGRYERLINRYSRAKRLPGLYAAWVAASRMSGEELKCVSSAAEFKQAYEACVTNKKGAFAQEVRNVYGPLFERVRKAFV